MDETAKLLEKKARLEEKIRDARKRDQLKAKRRHDKAVRIIGDAVMQFMDRSEDDKTAAVAFLNPLVTDAKDRALIGLPVADEPAYEPVSTGWTHDGNAT